MIIKDTTGDKFRIVDERLYRVPNNFENETECVLLSDLRRSGWATAFARNQRAELRPRFITRWYVTRLNIPFFPKIRIGCKVFKGDNARAIFIAAKGV